MKCIRCGVDNNLKERTASQGRCKGCNHAFTFEPTSMGTVKLTDAFFAKAIADLSASNTLFFTPKQLFYLLDQRLKRKAYVGVFPGFLCSLIFSAVVGGFFGANFAIFTFAGFNLLSIYSFFSSSNSPISSRQVRRFNANNLRNLGILILVVGVSFGIVTSSMLAYWLATLIGLGALWLGLWQKRRITTISEIGLISGAKVEIWLESWARANGSIEKLLPSPSSTLPSSSQNTDPDVTAYSFDRLIVCQTDAIAQMLIANNFHFENNCAILSLSGYPQRIFAVTMQMLRRNPELRVFAFHDCSAEGMELVLKLRTDSNWFPDDNIVILDVGLLPRQILAAKQNMFVQLSKASAQGARNLPASIQQNLSSVELQWLEAGNFVELESFTPQKLIQVLHRSIANSQQLDTIEDSNLILVGDSGGYFYATESFG